MTMFFSSSSSVCVPFSLGHKLFLFLLPILFAVQQFGMTEASPLIQQKDDSIPMPLVFDRPWQPPISLVPNPPPAYFVLPANVPLERPIYDQNDSAIEDELAEEAKAKRAQTFVRFGKRAQTFVRFGKRAQTFVRFGRDAQRQQEMANEQAQKKE
uniref:FMRFamide-related peptide 16 n=1 Tax=Heterodera glycines TaxID=51029 RepID=A0A977SM67_HETGL|nr:FMRFamide-related peptide 16 precursor [Heterodera glycines]